LILTLATILRLENFFSSLLATACSRGSDSGLGRCANATRHVSNHITPRYALKLQVSEVKPSTARFAWNGPCTRIWDEGSKGRDRSDKTKRYCDSHGTVCFLDPSVRARSSNKAFFFDTNSKPAMMKSRMNMTCRLGLSITETDERSGAAQWVFDRLASIKDKSRASIDEEIY
jgi:hypothetical protein